MANPDRCDALDRHDHASKRNRLRRTIDPTARIDLERRLLEAFDELWDSFVDPAEAVYDADGTRWNRLGGGRPAARSRRALRRRAATRRNPRPVPRAGRRQRVRHQRPREPHQLHRRQRAHAIGRRPQAGPHAPTHAARATCKRCSTSSSALNRWHAAAAGDRPPQGPRRRSASCGSSPPPTARTRVRFVEPDQVATPADRPADPSASFGIQTDPDDVETVLGYYIDGRLVDAAEIQHRKANVDANVKRGLPLFYPGAQEPPPGRKAAAQHERRGRDPIGHRPDPQAPRGHRGGAGAVRRRPGRRQRRPARQPAARAISAATRPARSSTPWPAPSTSSPPPASTPAAT